MISFQTVTGRRLDLEHPRPEDVDLRDITCGLARICRFTGQIRRFYSVAQHSLFVAALVEPRLRRAALAHDASEAYLNDLSRGLKHSDYLVGYRELESRWQDVINEALGTHVGPAHRQVLKAADDLAAVWERVVLRRDREWTVEVGLDEIRRCCDEGWVQSRYVEMADLVSRVPRSWTPLNPETVEVYFLLAWENAA